MLDVRERVKYTIEEKGQEQSYTSDDNDMLLLTPLCLTKNLERIGEMFYEDIKQSGDNTRIITVGSIFETSGYICNGKKYREIKANGLNNHLKIQNKKDANSSKPYRGFCCFEYSSSINAYLDGEGHLVKLDKRQLQLLSSLYQLSSNPDDISFVYLVKERHIQLVTSWELEYLIQKDNQEYVLDALEMQKISDVYTNSGLIKSKKPNTK